MGGSFVSSNIEDYYVEPYEVGYGALVSFEHDFIGREALVERKKTQKRRKMTLIWNNDDVFRVMQNALRTDGPRSKFISLPVPMYSSFQADQVLVGGKPAGVSNWMSYSSNAGAILSTALMDLEHCELGKEVTVLWGEPNTQRRTVEAHELSEIRATIAPVPYFDKTIKKDE